MIKMLGVRLPSLPISCPPRFLLLLIMPCAVSVTYMHMSGGRVLVMGNLPEAMSLKGGIFSPSAAIS